MVNETIVLSGLILILLGIIGNRKIEIKDVTIGDLSMAQRSIVSFLGIFVLAASFWPSFLMYIPPSNSIPAQSPTPIMTSITTPTITPLLISSPEQTYKNASECASGDIYNVSVRKLCSGYNMGVDDSKNFRNWLTDMGDYMRMTYPNGLEWGAVFITVGEPRNPPRPYKDFSTFSALSMDLKSEKSGEMIEIGIKDNTNPDDGSETKSQIDLTTEWQTYTFPIAKFYTAKPTRLYVVAEFVFSGSNAKTIYFRNIKYLP